MLCKRGVLCVILYRIHGLENFDLNILQNKKKTKDIVQSNRASYPGKEHPQGIQQALIRFFPGTKWLKPMDGIDMNIS